MQSAKLHLSEAEAAQHFGTANASHLDPGIVFDDLQDLKGFWNPVHAIPPPPRLVVGDPDKFKADLAACDARRKAIEDQATGTRWTVIRRWR